MQFKDDNCTPTATSSSLEITWKVQSRHYEDCCLLGSDEVQSSRLLKNVSERTAASIYMEAAENSSGKFLTIYETTRRHVQEDMTLIFMISVVGTSNLTHRHTHITLDTDPRRGTDKPLIFPISYLRHNQKNFSRMG
jgi:hypothetical protein